MKASPAAKSPPTIHENKTGNPSPPRNPVFAGSTASICSIAGPAIIFIRINPTIIIPAIK